MTLPILEIPEDLSRLCQPYRPVFSKPQFRQFERFLTALFVADEANIEALAEGYRLSQSYDALHHFVNGSPWEINDVLEQTVGVLKSLPPGQCVHDRGMLIIDDTLIEKYGKLMEAAGTLYDHSQGRYLSYAHCLVGLCWADHQKLRYPLRFEVYRKQEDCQRDGVSFKTKIRLAIELVDWAITQGIPFQTVVFDSWFFCRDLVDHLESLGKDWISMTKSNRRLIVNGRPYTGATYVETLTPLALPQATVRGKTYALSSVQARLPSLRRETETVRLVVSVEHNPDHGARPSDGEGKTQEGGGWKDPVLLVSNRKDIRPERLVRAYQIRWSIETFFKDAKSHLGLGEYQMRRLTGIKSHWCLVFTSAVLLELVRWEVCTGEGKRVSELSFGDLKQRAFGQTLKAIIRQVLDYGRNGLTDHEVFARLDIS